MSRFDIVYICNDAYMSMTGISIYSLLENNRAADQIHIYLAGDNISIENLEKLRNMVNGYGRKLHMIDVTEICKRLADCGIKKYKGKTYSPYLKNLMTGEMGDDVERLLYIDSDTVINGSLDDLFAMELDRPLYMVADVMWDFYKRHLGIERDAFYYNGGIILYNMPAWKEKDCYNRYWNFLKDAPKQYVLGDQDITNILFSKADLQKSEIGTLKFKYNYFLGKKRLREVMKEAKCKFYSEAEIDEADRNTVIYHCSKYDGERPWERGNQHPFREKYEYYKKKSPWENTLPFDKKTPKVFLIQKKLRKILPRFMYIPVLRIAQFLYFHNSEKQINA